MSMAADASRLASDGTGPPTKSGKQGGKSGKATMECPAGMRKLIKEKYRGKITGYQVCLRRVVSLFAPNRTPTNVALTLPPRIVYFTMVCLLKKRQATSLHL